MDLDIIAHAKTKNQIAEMSIIGEEKAVVGMYYRTNNAAEPMLIYSTMLKKGFKKELPSFVSKVISGYKK